MLDDELVFVDLETTGGNARHHRVIEVGLVRVAGNTLEEEWSSLVDPEEIIPASIQALTGIDNHMVGGAPTFRQIADDLLERIQGRLFIAHNARFDYAFLRNEFRRLGVSFKERVLCTVKLSRALYPGERRHNLDAVMARHGLSCGARHRALGDARVLWEFIQLVRNKLPGEDIDAAVRAQLKKPSLPPHLPPGTLDDIPEAPGVYRFFGEEDALLYVGKSVNLRSRVMAHFAADHREQKEMRLSQEVRRIEWSLTAGELGALLQESREVKTSLPIHNRKLRNKRDLFAIRFEPGAARRIDIVELKMTPGTGHPPRYGIFHTRRKARNWLEKLARDEGLCSKLLGFEKGPGPCFAYQLKRCRGACVGEESQARHDLRLMSALVPQKIRAWPFKGRIGIREIGLFGDTDIHVFDHWCYLGSATSEDELWPLLDTGEEPVFDVDCYRILGRFLGRRNFRPAILDLEGRHRPAPMQLKLVE